MKYINAKDALNWLINHPIENFMTNIEIYIYGVLI